MATDWTTKQPNIPFNSPGGVSVVVLREYQDIMTAPNFRSVEYIITDPDSVVKQGIRTILDARGKDWPGFANMLGAGMPAIALEVLNGVNPYLETNELFGAGTFNPETYLAGPTGTPVPSPSALLATVGVSEQQFSKRAVLWENGSDLRGLQCEGPFFPPRPGINVVLYKVTIGGGFTKNPETQKRDIPWGYNSLSERRYPERIAQILAKGAGYYKEAEFKNFDDFSNQLAEVSAVLKEYEQKHQKLQAKEKPKQYIGPEIGDKYRWSEDGVRPVGATYGLLNLEDEGEKLDELSFKIKDFLRLNGLDTSKDKFTIGFYPLPKPTPAESVDDTESAASDAPAPVGAGAASEDSTTAGPANGSSSGIELPTLTSQETADIAYTNKYKVSAGDNLWNISKFYTGNGMRYKDIMSLNKSKSPYKNRGWLSAGQIKKLKQQLAVSTKPSEQSALEEKIRVAEKALIYPEDILEIPSSWLDEIAEDYNWATKKNAAGRTTITYSPLHFVPGTTPPTTTATDDGVNNAALDENNVPIDPWFSYDEDSLFVTTLERSRIAYIKKSTKKYESALTDYNNLLKQVMEGDIVENPTEEILPRFEKAEARYLETIKTENVYLWHGFLSLVYSHEYKDPRTADFLTKLNVLIREPGVKGALLRLCSSSSKPPKKAKTINQFVKKYIYDPPLLKDIVPSEDEIEAWKRFKARQKPAATGATSKPKTEEEVIAEIRIAKSSVVKKAIARRNQKISSQAGDAVFASLPRSVNRIDSLNDVHRYVLSRMSFPTMAEEILKCLGLGFSLDDLIEMLCDGFLKQIGADPNKIDELFELLRMGEFNFEIKGIELFDTAGFAQDIQKDMASMVASGVNDPFYSAMIKQNIGNARGKRIICELIMGAMFALADLLASLGSAEDPRGPNKSKCSIPRFEWPSIPSFGALLPPIIEQLEKKFYQFLEKLIRDIAKDLIENIIEFCAEDDPVFGSPPPPITDPVILARVVAPLQQDPKEFLAHLLSTLTANELCRLVEGTAGRPLLLQVRKFMKRNYFEHFDMFSSDYKIFSFFKSLQGALDLSACPVPPPQFSLDNLCKDGTTPRENALRNSLLAKGLSPEEVEAQLQLDKEIKGAIVSDLVGNMFPGDSLDSAKTEIDMNGVISKAKSLEKGNNSVINSTLKSMQTTIYNEVGYFVPTIFSELENLRKEGFYDFEGHLPTFSVLEDFAEKGWTSKISFTDPNDRNVFRWDIPEIKYTPGRRFYDANAHQYVEEGGSVDPGGTQKRLKYDLMSYNNVLNTSPKNNDIFFFNIRSTIENKDIYVAKKSEKGVEIKDEELKAAIEAYPVVNGDIPRQIDVFSQFLKEKIENQYEDAQLSLVGAQAAMVATGLQSGGDEWYGISNLGLDCAPNEGNPWTLSEYIYGTSFVSVIDRMLKMILTSDYFNISNEGALKNLDLLSEKLGELEDIKKQAKERAHKLMGQHDFTSGKPPTYLGEALIEAAARCLIKFSIIQNTLRAFPVFSKFKVSDAFSDAIMEDYITNSIKQVQDGKMYGLYRDFIAGQEAKLRRKLEAQGPASKPPSPILSDKEIDEEVKKQIYNEKAENPDDYIMSFVSETSEDIKDKIIAVFGNVVSDVDERVELRKTGLLQSIDKLKLEGTTPSMGPAAAHGHVHAYAIDEDGNGKAEKSVEPLHPEMEHEHAIVNFVVQPASTQAYPTPVPGPTTLCDGTIIEPPQIEAVQHTHLLERKDYPPPVIDSITTIDNEVVNKDITDGDDAAAWQRSAYNHISTRGSTCMLEYIGYSDASYAIQIPPETTLPPGTNWDPDERVLTEFRKPEFDELPTTSTKFIGDPGGYDYYKQEYNYATHQMETVAYHQGPSVVRERLVQCEAAAEHKFKKYYGGLYNPFGLTTAGKPATHNETTRWAPLFIRENGINIAPNLQWTEDSPYSPYFGMYFWWDPITKLGADGHILKIKTTHKYAEDKRPKTSEEFHGFTSGDLVEGVPRTLYYKYQGSKAIKNREIFFGQASSETNSEILNDLRRENGLPHPLIQLRVPTRGSDDEINIEEIKEIKFKINGENFRPGARAFLVGQHFGNFYDINIDKIEDNVIDVSIPIKTLGAEHKYIGDDMDADRNDVRQGHGHIDYINGRKVVDDIYVLQVSNPKSDERAVAPLWFHTFTPFGRGMNTSKPFGPHFTSDITNDFKNELGPTFRKIIKTPEFPQFGYYPWPVGMPEAGMPFAKGPRPDEGINQIFALTTFGSGGEGWDIFDVADTTGISERDSREKVLCVPRISHKSETASKVQHGGFILEKYIKLKFKDYLTIKDKDSNIAEKLYAGGDSLDDLRVGEESSFEYKYLTFVENTEVEATATYNKNHQKFATPGLVMAPFHPHILSYDAFVRLTENLLGYASTYDKDTGLPTNISENIETSSPYLDTKSFSEILDYVSYGLRLSYVTPALTDSLPGADTGNLRTSAYLKNMFSPKEDGSETIQQGAWGNAFSNPADPAIRRHITRTSARNKAFLLTEYNGLIPGIHKVTPPTIEGESPEYTFNPYWKEDVIDQDVCVIPLIDVELPSDDPQFPSRIIKTFQDLRAAYPSETSAPRIPFGREVYDELYIRLKTHPDFKLLFDYILPAKRALALTTIYNMLSFDSIFPDPCKFQELFSLSHSISTSLLERLTEDPTMLSDIKLPKNPKWETTTMIRDATGFGEGCSDPRLETINPAVLGAAAAGLGELAPASFQALQGILTDQLLALAGTPIITGEAPIPITTEGEEETEETPEE